MLIFLFHATQKVNSGEITSPGVRPVSASWDLILLNERKKKRQLKQGTAASNLHSKPLLVLGCGCKNIRIYSIWLWCKNSQGGGPTRSVTRRVTEDHVLLTVEPLGHRSLFWWGWGEETVFLALSKVEMTSSWSFWVTTYLSSHFMC